MPDKEKTQQKLNLHQKLLKIADMAGVLRKDKSGFNYKYTPEDEIQAKITAGMQKYGVNLLPSLVPGTLEVTPYSYEKIKTKKVNGAPVEYSVAVNEIIVKSEVEYTWIDVDNPEDTYTCRWAYIGQMEDASQAFGAGATYGNRYYLMKALQLATTEDDPDSYRSKQAEAEKYEEEKEIKKFEKELSEKKTQIKEAGSELISGGCSKDEISKVVSDLNNGNANPGSIKTIEICDAILNKFEEMKKNKTATKKSAEAKKGENK